MTAPQRKTLVELLFPNETPETWNHVMFAHTPYPFGREVDIVKALLELSQLRHKHGLQKAIEISIEENWEKPMRELKNG